MATITVVVPVHDVENYLEERLGSVAAQTVRDIEVVMVDDGSTDSSAEIAERFARRDARFRLLRQPNGGLRMPSRTIAQPPSGVGTRSPCPVFCTGRAVLRALRTGFAGQPSNGPSGRGPRAMLTA